MDRFSAAKRLSPRQREVIELAAQGLSDRQIAMALGIKVETVRSYWRELRARYGHTNRAHVIATTLADGSVSYPAKVVDRSALEVKAESQGLCPVWESILASLESPMMVVWGGEGRVVLVNDSLKQLIRRPVPYSKARSDYGDWHGYDTDGQRLKPDGWPVSRTLDGQGAVEQSLFLRRGDGTWALVRVRSIPILKGGIVEGALSFLTLLKESEEPPPGYSGD